MQMPLTSQLNSLTDGEVAAYALEQGLNFALLREPMQPSATLLVSEECYAGHMPTRREGFLCAPFANDHFLFFPDQYTRNISPGPGASIMTSVDTGKYVSGLEAPTEYLASVSELVEILRQKGGKTVFSHRFEVAEVREPFEIFAGLCRKYPNAYVYCWHKAGKDDIWIGATPELLLRSRDAKLETMALAGTRCVTDGIDTPWDDKNIEEQSMVTEYILDTFAHCGLSAHAGSTHTLAAGPVEHICTDISARCKVGYDLESLLLKLAPTPAVAGSDKAASLAFIQSHEHYDREYYGGYCGLIKPGGCFDFYVMLRCAKLVITTRHAYIYVGGGITAASVPQEEWAELCAKASTLAPFLIKNTN